MFFVGLKFLLMASDDCRFNPQEREWGKIILELAFSSIAYTISGVAIAQAFDFEYNPLYLPSQIVVWLWGLFAALLLGLGTKFDSFWLVAFGICILMMTGASQARFL